MNKNDIATGADRVDDKNVATANRFRNDAFAVALRGVGPISVLAFLIIVFTGNIVLPNMVVLPVGAALVMLWAWLSGTPWGEIGFRRPSSWVLSVSGGVIFGVVTKLAMKALVMPLFGAPPLNQTFQFLYNNSELLPIAVWAMLVAGFAEETVFRGYMFERFGKVFGTGTRGLALAITISTVWFALGHYSLQGWAGVGQALITGLVFSALYVYTRQLYIVMITHAVFDLTALALIYFGWEMRVAGFFFG